MTVIEDYEEPRTDRHPLLFRGYKNLEEVHEWLFQHYQGYHFCILFNEVYDEFIPLPKELRVYFSDEALMEIATFTNYEVKKKVWNEKF